MPRWYSKDSTTGNMIPLGVKVEDTLPVGTEIDYDGQDIPEGWEEIDGYEQVSATDYITLSNSFNINEFKAYKLGNIVFIGYNLTGTINEGETVLGSCTNKLVMTMFGNARIMNAQSVLRRATTIAIPSGAFRLYSPISGNATTGTIILLVND